MQVCLTGTWYIVYGCDAQLSQSPRDMAQRQAHHISEALCKVLRRIEAVVLNGIRARLIEGITAGDVRLDLWIGISPHPNVARGEIGNRSIGGKIDQRDRRMNLVHAIA